MSTTGFKVISRYDPALDVQAMGEEGIARYRDTCDFSQVKIVEGATPAVFHCRRLKASELASCRSEVGEARLYWAAFCRGVMRVDGLRKDEEGDARIDWTRPDAERPLTTREVDAVFDGGDVQEIGSAIYGRSILGKGRPAAWPQPDTSLLAVQGLVLRLAEQMKASAPSAQNRSEVEELPGTTSAG